MVSMKRIHYSQPDGPAQVLFTLPPGGLAMSPTLTPSPQRVCRPVLPESARVKARTSACETPSDHLVQFYENDEFLVGSVGRFVTEGLAGNGAALVVATAAHRRGVEAYLAAAGMDVAALVSSGRYVALDAEDTLAKIREDGMLKPDLIEAQLGASVTKLAAGGGQLHVFGELVSLLWAEGNADAVMQLEDWWNRLSQRHRFRLLCAYPMKDFATGGAGEGFVQVCNAHSHVLAAEGFGRSGDESDERLRTIALLQQKTAALEGEIAQRRRVEVTLRHRDAELTAFVETSSLGLHWVDAKGVIIWANQAELDLLGVTAAEYIGHQMSEFHEDVPALNDILQRLRQGERVRNFEARLRCKNGTMKTVLIDSSALERDGEFVHTQCFTRDITAQRAAEVGSRYLAAIIESSDDAIVSKNLDGIVTSWNNGAQRIFGYTAEEMIGQPISKLIPPGRLNEEPEILARLRAGNRVDHFETVRRRKDGTLLDISVTISPVRDAHGVIVGASKVARDITEKKRAEAALAAAREQLKRANEELERRIEERTASLREAVEQMEEFSYTVSHDLRAPLRGMQLYSHALLEDYGTRFDAEARHCLERIAENAARLDKMVTDVLTFSRVSRSELRLDRINLDQLVRSVIEQYPAMQPPRARIEVAPLHEVEGHEPSLVQIVSNLLANAVKFVEPGVVPVVRVWTEKNAAGVRLWVQDNGIGIEPDRQERLFKMFERVHPDLPYEGTGVGLAIVRKAALRMGGDVGAHSAGEGGASFWVQLRSPGDLPANPAPPPNPPSGKA